MSNLEELLDMFQLSIPFTKDDLKKVKKKVLMLHPDKHVHNPNIHAIYEKYKNAYLKLESLSQMVIKNGSNIVDDIDSSFRDFIKDKNLSKEEFHKKFNHMFENVYLKEEDDGYDNWFKSNEGIYDKNNIESSRQKIIQQNQLIQKKKDDLDTYSRETFSDLKNAHMNTLIDVEVNEVLKQKETFRTVEELKTHRNNKIQLKSKEESQKILQSTYKKDTHDSLKLAFQYKEQEEKINERQKNYISRFLMVQNS